MMDTREVAAYLRLKERRVYDLVNNALPHIRATGKLLFPRAQIDAWLAAKAGAPTTVPRPRRRSSPAATTRCSNGRRASRAAGWPCSRAAAARASSGWRAMRRTVAAMHWLDAATGEYNVPLVRARMPGADLVVIEWARRVQGLLLAAGNPLKIKGLRDLARRKARVIGRQDEAGSQQLLLHLLAQAGIARTDLDWPTRPALAETDLAAAIREGRADAGVAIEAAARAHGLAFIRLADERLDLVVHRRDYFEPPVQALLAFARTEEFTAQALAMGGYDVGTTGRVVFNAESHPLAFGKNSCSPPIL